MEFQNQANQNDAVELPAECLELLILTIRPQQYLLPETYHEEKQKQKIQLVFPSNFLMQDQLHPPAEGS